MKKRKLLLILSAACLLCAICSVGCTPAGNSTAAPKQDGSTAEIDDTLVQDKTDTGDDEKNGPCDTPQEPSEPKIPDTGGEKEDTTPDKDPDVEEPNPDVPDPDPEEPGPEEPDDSEPDTPDTPETPDEPDTPEDPDEPDEPEKPDPNEPDNPDDPNPDPDPDPDPEPDPDEPKDPDEPDEPDNPDEPTNPDTPTDPDNPDEPTDPDPDDPEKPDPEDPEEPEIPEEPHLFPAALVGTFEGTDVQNIAYIVEISPDGLTVFIEGEEAFVADVGYDAESGAVTLTLNGLPCTMTLTGEGLLLTSSDFFTFNVTLTRTA